jgi:phosphatidylglycerophosphate synthase
MIDGLFKEKQDRLWDHVGRAVAKTGATPNQITTMGLLLAAGCCVAYVFHRIPWVFGLTLGLSELFDNVDGAVARVTRSSSKFGAYLDATTDRYKEAFVLGAIAHVTGEWTMAFVALTGSLITSYNKARAGMEIPISNDRWPDVFERFERLLVLIAGLVASAWIPRALPIALIVVAVGSCFTSVQRLVRARRLFATHELLARAPRTPTESSNRSEST